MWQELVDKLRQAKPGGWADDISDAATTVARHAILEPVSGIAGLNPFVRSLASGAGYKEGGIPGWIGAGAAAAQPTIDWWQQQAGGPATEGGAKILQGIGDVAEPVLKKAQQVGDWVGEQSPAAGAILAGGVNALPGETVVKEAAKAGRIAKAATKGEKALRVQRAAEGLSDVLRSEQEVPTGLTAAQQQDIASRVTPKVTARGPSLGTPEADAAFQAKYGRKPLYAMDEPERVQHFGPAMTESPDTWISDLKSRKAFNIPGGFEGDLTLPDAAKISAQAIDYNDLDPRFAQALHEKLVRSSDPGVNMPDTERFGRLMFGITSGNAPITKNLIEYAQMRPRSNAEIGEWANYSPVGPNDVLDPNYKTALNRSINEAYGVQASERGGTGVANTANRQYVSDLAKMYQQNPGFFVKAGHETDAQFVERLMNQVRGLGPKTGSLGFAMLEPQTSNISAIDRHIADITRNAVSQDPATAQLYSRRMVEALNAEQPKSRQAKTLETARSRAGEQAETIEGDKFRDIVSTPQGMVYRSKKTGEVNPAVPEHLRDLPFYEPQQAQVIGPLYEAALRKIQEGGQQRGIGGFSNQWFDWDYQRSRAEPHAALNKLAGTIPRLTPEEYAMVRDTFSGAGAFRTTKDPATGRLSPLKPTADWRRLVYGNADPALLGGLGLATGAGAYAGQDEDVREFARKLSDSVRGTSNGTR